MNPSDNPYKSLPESRFWRSAVAERHFSEIGPLWEPKADLKPSDRIATFGSCFAQHIGRALRARKHHWLITEPGPHGLSEANRLRFNYGIFTCRTGNIYTPSLLLQWLRWALGAETPPGEVWRASGDRLVDPFRPAIEPDGFADAAELLRSRSATLAALREAVLQADVFVFTLGLTESWFHAQAGYEYPTCPGTVAGEFDAQHHRFVNQDFGQVLESMQAAIALMRSVNPRIRVLLTVSPVPLTASMSGQHVLVATTHSKAILRAVAGQLAATCGFVDYFPSFEIITAPPFRGMHFAPNQRNVAKAGVDFVMASLFDCLNRRFPDRQQGDVTKPAPATHDAAEVCEEALLAAFGSR